MRLSDLWGGNPGGFRNSLCLAAKFPIRNMVAIFSFLNRRVPLRAEARIIFQIFAATAHASSRLPSHRNKPIIVG
jgi:hypothetical protein